MRKPVTALIEGDVIDLEGHDAAEANRQIWPFEYARVESVSVAGALSGGWLDGYLASPQGTSMALIYTENGAVPALVPNIAQLEIIQE